MTSIQCPFPAEGKNIPNKRIAGLDAVKLIAMLSVVVSHALNVLIAYRQDPVMTTICHSLTAGGVPLFFMVSGYLLLGRKEVTPAYACRKVYSIIRYIIIVCLIYQGIASAVCSGTPFWPGCLEEVFRTMVLRGPFTPFWFLWSMAIIYAALPAIHRLYLCHTKAFAISTGILGLACIALFIAQLFGSWADTDIIQPLKMWKWLFFFAAGGVLRAYPAPRLHWDRIAVCTAILNAAQRYFLEPVMHDTSNLAFAGSPISLLFYI